MERSLGRYDGFSNFPFDGEIKDDVKNFIDLHFMTIQDSVQSNPIQINRKLSSVKLTNAKNFA